MRTQKAFWLTNSLQKDVERLAWLKVLMPFPFKTHKRVKASAEGTRLFNKYFNGETTYSSKNFSNLYPRDNLRSLSLYPPSKKTLEINKKWIIVHEQF